MKTFRKSLLASILWLFWFIMLIPCFVLAQQQYDDVLGITTDDKSLYTAIRWDEYEKAVWAELFNGQVLKIMGYVIDIFIVIWIAVAFIWAYEIMTSDKEESMKKWIRLVAFWVIWIIIMVSARFIANWLVWDEGWIISEQWKDPSHNPSWIAFADNLYKNIMFPFIKLALYFVVGALFFVMVGKAISFLMATDDSAKKKAWGIIIWCVVWILIVMWSKQIVEAVMWKQNEVLNKSAQRISWWDEWLWEEILEFGSIPLIAQIINWVMWLTMFAIVVLIIIQWYKVFTKPDDPKTREGMKKAIIYILIWVLVIWAAYVISNFLVVNNVPIAAS